MKRIPLTVNWIPVSDSLPQEGDFVFVAWTDDNGMRWQDIAMHDGCVFHDGHGPFSNVDFWMPLPVLPENVVLEDE